MKALLLQGFHNRATLKDGQEIKNALYNVKDRVVFLKMATLYLC